MDMADTDHTKSVRILGLSDSRGGPFIYGCLGTLQDTWCSILLFGPLKNGIVRLGSKSRDWQSNNPTMAC